MISPEFVAEVFQEQLRPHRVASCRIRQAWPQPDGSFVTSYELLVKGPDGRCERQLVHAHLGLDESKQNAYEKAKSLGEPVTYLPSLSAALWMFPWDSELRHLDVALDGEAMADIFRWTLPSMTDNIQSCSTTLAAYKPRRRAIVRYLVTREGREDLVCYGKVYRDHGGARMFDLSKGLWEDSFGPHSTDGIMTARPLAYLPELRMILQEEATGCSVFELLRDDQLPYIGGLVAQALAKFHRVSPPASPVHDARAELHLVERWIKGAVVFCPALEQKLYELLEDLERAKDHETTRPQSAVHRDFYDKQVFFSDSRVTLLDFDEFAQGEPALDVGNFLAHLRLRSAQSLLGTVQAEEIARAFLRAYRDEVRISQDRIAFYKATSLLRLVCVYAMRPKWASVIPVLLSEAEQFTRVFRLKVDTKSVY